MHFIYSLYYLTYESRNRMNRLEFVMKTALPFHPRVSTVDSSILESGHALWWTSGFQSKTKSGMVDSFIWIYTVCTGICIGPQGQKGLRLNHRFLECANVQSELDIYCSHKSQKYHVNFNIVPPPPSTTLAPRPPPPPPRPPPFHYLTW